MFKINLNKPFLLFAIFFLPLFSAAQDLWRLEDCISYAMAHNLQIKQSELRVKSAEIDVHQNQWAFAPSVEASSSLNFNWANNNQQRNLTNNYGVNAGVSLFSGFRQWNQYAKSRIDRDISLLQADMMRKDIALNITAHYLNILYSREMLLVTYNQLVISEMQVERVRALVEAGTLPQGNLLEIQSQAATEESNIVSARNQLALAYLNLKQLLELSANDDFEIDTSYQPHLLAVSVASVEQVYAKALQLMPEIKAAELGVQSAQKAEQIAKGGSLPVLSLSAGVQSAYYDNANATLSDASKATFWQQIDDNTGKYVGLSLSVPIFHAFSAQNSIQKAKINSLNMQYDLDLQKNSLRKIIEQQQQDALAALQSYQASVQAVAALQRAFEYSHERFDVGLINAVDYNTAKIKLAQAQSQQLRAKYDYVFKNKILDYYMGIPLSL